MNSSFEQSVESASVGWAWHFCLNRERDWAIPWDSGQRLSLLEVDRIRSSIAEFQRGESSEAHGYLAKSAVFSRLTEDRAFHEASVLFVAEENHHAALLLRFMIQTGVPRRPSSWGDGVFRWLRRWSDLGWASRVLIVAELIAQAYYPCLWAATTHPVLRRICEKIVADEADHIRFQVQRIAQLEFAQSRRKVVLRDILQRGLMIGAAAVVYAGHRKVLHCRLTWRTFLREVMQRNAAAIAAIAAIRRSRAS